MQKSLVHTVVILLSLCLALAPMSAMAMEESATNVFKTKPSGEAMIGDALVVRPVSIVCLGVSSFVFLIGWPFAAAGGNEAEAKQALLKDPVRYTFKRPLGAF